MQRATHVSELRHREASDHACEAQHTLFEPVRELVRGGTRSDRAEEEPAATGVSMRTLGDGRTY